MIQDRGAKHAWCLSLSWCLQSSSAAENHLKIVECAYELDRRVWRFMRVRTDKNTPNAMHVFLKVRGDPVLSGCELGIVYHSATASNALTFTPLCCLTCGCSLPSKVSEMLRALLHLPGQSESLRHMHHPCRSHMPELVRVIISAIQQHMCDQSRPLTSSAILCTLYKCASRSRKCVQSPAL